MSVTNRTATGASASALMALLTVAIGFSLGVLGSANHSLADVKKTNPADTKKGKSDSLKAFQGTWQTAENEGIDAKWTFEGTTLKATVNGVDYTCKVDLDAEAKPHPTMDLVIDEGPDDAKGKTSKAIYKLDGEKLTICVSMPGKDRPKDFMQVEDEAYLFELKKQKKN
jgi:uncharacterized protein (TIGR03067 family)